jgi:hypothetical protein
MSTKEVQNRYEKKIKALLQSTKLRRHAITCQSSYKNVQECPPFLKDER